ncbi:MAG: glycosyltransferase family protein [Ignavibacteria bacterium]|nr:glycosyltransferase family protein [Ignavibacteria bacterium]
MVTAIIQARVNSTRLPNKIFCDIEGFPLIWHIVNRIKTSKKINDIIIATSDNKKDDILEKWCLTNNIKCFRGSEKNVLERFYFSALKYETEIIARITADDPFKDPEIIDNVIDMLITKNLDFAFNNKPPTFPEGLDTEIFTFSALKNAYENSLDPFEQEHVTQFFYRNPNLFLQKNYSNSQNFSNLRWTVDTEKDLEMVKVVYKHLFSSKQVFLFNDILNLIYENPWISNINLDVERSIMYKKEVENGEN